MSRGLPPSWRAEAPAEPLTGRFLASARLGTPAALSLAPTRPAWPRPQLRTAGEGSEAPAEEIELHPDLYPVFHADVLLVHGQRRALWMDLLRRRALPVDPGLAELARGWSERPVGEALATHGDLARRVLRVLLERDLLSLSPWPEQLGPRAVNLPWPGRLSDLVLSWGPGSDYPAAERAREAEALGARSILLRCSNSEDTWIIEQILDASADTALSVDLWLPAGARWPEDPHIARVLLFGAPRAELLREGVEACTAPLALDEAMAPSPDTLVVDPELADAARLGHGLALGRLYVDPDGGLRATPLGAPLPADSLEQALALAVEAQSVRRDQVSDCARCELRLCCPDAEPLVMVCGIWRRLRPCGYQPGLGEWSR